MKDKPACDSDGCNKPVRARGLCENHYRQALHRSQRYQRPRSAPTCERGGCDEKASRRGLCSKHYERERSRHRHREDRVLPTRARNRALSRLVQAHKEEFDRLYVTALAEVTQENVELEKACEANDAEPTNNKQVYRFKSGPKPDDEEVEDRIVKPALVCSQCEGFHASGHRCLHCGSLPSRVIYDEPALRKLNPKLPIVVPADMTDERIKAAVERGKRHNPTPDEGAEDEADDRPDSDLQVEDRQWAG